MRCGDEQTWAAALFIPSMIVRGLTHLDLRSVVGRFSNLEFISIAGPGW
jgi:hypothetical protein